ncbi:MAG: hemerythrin domain-containing protein [Myxococcales bacterium]
MPSLVATLLQQHADLSAAMRSVLDAGIASDDGRERLRQLKALLLEHLALEDAELYPTLVGAGHEDREFARLLGMYAEDMRAVTEDAAALFLRIDDAHQPEPWVDQVASLIARLKFRMASEERMLFGEYERIVGATLPEPRSPDAVHAITAASVLDAGVDAEERPHDVDLGPGVAGRPD